MKTLQHFFLKNYPVVLALVLATLLASCESPTRGCLDIEATNLDVSADKPCKDDCCTYPDLICNISQVFDGETWKQDDVDTNDLGQVFRIKDVAFYLSGFQLSKAGVDYFTTDSVAMKVFGPGTGDTLDARFRDDYVLVRRFPVAQAVGQFKTSGIFDQFNCNLGLLPDANNVVPRYAPLAHPLAKQNDSLWLNRNDKFVWMQIILVKDALSVTLPDTLRFTAADFGGVPYKISKPTALEHVTGFDFNFILLVDYARMFSGVDFANTGSAAWKSRILANLSTTFDVLQ